MSRKRCIVTRNGLRWTAVFVLALVCGAGAQSSAAQSGAELDTTAPSAAEISEERQMNLLIQSGDEPDAAAFGGAEISKERQLKLLLLQEAELALKTAETVYNREDTEYKAMKAMYDDGVVSGALHDNALREYEASETTYEKAKIALRRTELGFLQQATHITIIETAKYTGEDDQLWMRFTIENSSDVEQAIVKPEDELKRDLLEAALRIENLVISITKSSVNVGDPLELKVSKLDYGERYTGEFLLRVENIDDVTLSMEYLGTKRSEQVYLRKESGEDIVRVICLQPALEGTLRNKIDFSMRLERLAEDERSFALIAIGLPLKIKYQFEYQNRTISQLKFSRRSQSYDPVTVECFVPEDIPEDELEIPIPFYAVVADSVGVKRVQDLVRDLGNELPTREQLARLKVGFEMLELIPKGFGEMQVRVANALVQITQGEDAEALLEIQNTGTVELLAVKVVTDAPPGWKITMEPEVIERVGIKDRQAMRVLVDLPDDMEVGQYEMRVWAECDHRGEQIKAIEKNIKIDVEARARLLFNSILAVALLLAVVGVAVFTIRVARR